MANASLELRDLKTSQTMLVPPDGLVFGREGGDADVTFRDAGISKRHARVFQQGNSWMLQDLGSSNGTWMKGQRIGDAVKLNPGDIFILNKQQLQVMQVVMPTSAGAETYGDMPAQGGDEEEEQPNEPTPKPQPPPKAPGRGSPEPRSAANKVPAGSANKKPPPQMLRPAPDELPEEPEPAAREDGDEPPADDGMPDDTGAADGAAAADQLKSAGIGYFMVSVPKAIAYYLGAVPVMLFNPVGTIRNGPKKQKFEAMGPMGLIPYALVPGLIGAVLGFLGNVVAQLVGMIFYHGGLSIGSLLGSLIVGPIVAVVVAVITGFVFHPVLNWIVKFLKGTSDPKSRTNYFIQMQTATVLVQVPSFLAPIMLMIHLPLIGIVPLIVGFACSIITLFVAYTWFVHFNVVKWFQYVILAIGGLTALSTLAGLPGAIRGGGSVGAVAVGSGSTADMDDAMAKLKAQAEEAQKNGEAARKDAQAQIDKAMKDAKGATDDAKAAVDQAKEDAKEATKPPPPAKDVKEAKDTPPPPKKDEKVAAKDSPPPAKDPGGDGKYSSWNSHREQLEKLVTDDPQVLDRVGGLADMYKKYERLAYEAEQKCAKATAKAPSDRRYNEHMRDLELFKQTNGLVADMWERTGH